MAAPTSTGRYTTDYKFIVEGFGLSGEASTSGPGSPQVSLAYSDEASCEYRLTVVIDGVTEQDGAQQTRQLAGSVYERILLEFGSSIGRAVPPVRDTFSFLPTAGNVEHRGLAVGFSSVIGVGRSIFASNIVCMSLDAVLSERAGVTVSPMLATARQMFRSGFESADPVVSYLICYSALAMGAQHGLGKGRQQDVDELLLKEDDAIPKFPHTRPDGRLLYETLYTAVRNNFVHAEDRGNDPKTAAAKIRDNLTAFRDLAARILLKL